MLLLGSTATMMHACAWDDSLYEEFVIEDGKGGHVESCSNLQKIMIYNYEEQTTTTYERDKDEGDFANAFTYNLCPEKAHNCIDGNDENKPGICNNCPDKHAVCKNKCVDISQENLHIDDCILDNLTCQDDYYDFNDDSSDGCEFQLSPVHIDKTRPQTEGSWNCLDGYADIDKTPYNGCEINGWTDKAHCGAGIIDGDTRKTGVQCEDYEVCTRGTCTESCGEDYMLVCDSQCVNTNIDNAYCGGCDSPCSLTVNDARAAVACQNGGCHAIACQPGYYLEDADEAVAGKIVKTCKPCADGKYTTSATAKGCIDCPTTTGAASMVFDPQNNICKAETCLAGYKLVNNEKCEPCEAGTYSAELGATSCTPCADGHFSGLAASSCTPCPAGTYTTDHIQCINCLAGEYSDEGSNTCSDCTGDTISAAGSAMCAECKGNTHANYDHTACVGCNNASDCTLTTGVKSIQCKANVCEAATCNNGYKLNDGQCEPCEPGTFLGGWINGVTADACTACGENNFSGRAASYCTPCPAGTHTVGDDRTTCEALNCGSGYHVDVNECKEDSTEHCGAPGNKCATLTYGTSDCTNGQCVYTCNAGYYWKAEGCTDNKCCQPCPAGSYCPTAGLTSPIPCPIGHYCPAKNHATCGTNEYCQNNLPTPCSEGTYQENMQSTQCEPCGNNQISAAGSATCAQCSQRTYANSDHTACVGCNTKDDCVKTTGANEMRCSSEKFCKAKSCLAGYKLINNEKCEPCPAGSISTSDNKCTQCLAGTYAEDNECKQCPAGSYCPTAGLTSPIPCTIGHYCPAKGSNECGAGTACANNHPMPCPTGTYQGERGKTSVSECLNCPKGTHNDGIGAWACALIPAGYIGLNCRNDSKKEGCTQYSMCFDGNSVTKCSKMYGSNSACSSGYCMDTTQTTSTSCIADNNGCPAVACCNGACATNNDNCGSCGTKCTGNKTCKFSDNTWKCQ